MTAEVADLLLTRGVVYTMDPQKPRLEAVAVAGDRILATGTSSELAGYKGPNTTVIDLAGRALVPGFYDAHQHQVYRGLATKQVNGRAHSIDELIARVRARASDVPAGTWIEGVGYDDGSLRERRHPNRKDLDEAAPGHPTFVTRTCGHIMALNSLALRAAGITAETPDPPGGRIDRDPATGEPTGIIREKAMERLRRVVPLPTTVEIMSAIEETAEANLRAGVTSLWEPSIEPSQLDAYLELEARGRLTIRVTMAHKRILRDGTKVALPQPRRGPWLTTAGVKVFQDGAIAPRTAALSEPYEAEPENRGLLIMSQDELDELVCEIHTAGLQACIHAIGDAAIDSALTSIERANAKLPRLDARHRIEHCGLPLPYLHERIKALGVVAVLQPPFIHFHGDTYASNLGAERARWLYPTRTLMGLCPIAGSSDGPVVPDCRPLFGIRVAMTRLSAQRNVVTPEEKVGFHDALRMYTLGGAVAAHEEDSKGSIAPGKLADLVVLGADPGKVEPDQVDQVPVEMVFVGGLQVAGG
jgi:predicted amidohydrolase YtcJ